ncbi:MAG: hypothetical protein IJP30_01585 [Clostridia bacterium]|nr:hypothetical protein [Clostridia bacterium]
MNITTTMPANAGMNTTTTMHANAGMNTTTTMRAIVDMNITTIMRAIVDMNIATIMRAIVDMNITTTMPANAATNITMNTIIMGVLAAMTMDISTRTRMGAAAGTIIAMCTARGAAADTSMPNLRCGRYGSAGCCLCWGCSNCRFLR